ncbi:MAG: hypothetical protein IKM00_01940, partial [Clostridia bacterium]|nr:hypothetical protein [Clostridia bacterium]
VFLFPSNTKPLRKSSIWNKFVFFVEKAECLPLTREVDCLQARRRERPFQTRIYFKKVNAVAVRKYKEQPHGIFMRQKGFQNCSRHFRISVF